MTGTTSPATILNFGTFGIPDARLDTPATTAEINEKISDELTSAGYDMDVITLVPGKGGQVVDVADGDDFILGTVTIVRPAPDAVVDATPSARLLAAVRQVIAAGHLDWEGGVDVEGERGRAHLALVEAYQAATGDTPAGEPGVREALADRLHRIAADLVTKKLPLPGTMCASLGLGVLDSRADLEQWAQYLGSTIATDPSNNIPHTNHTIRLDGRPYGPQLRVGAQIRADEPSEVERLRARNAELEAELAARTQGGAR